MEINTAGDICGQSQVCIGHAATQGDAGGQISAVGRCHVSAAGGVETALDAMSCQAAACFCARIDCSHDLGQALCGGACTDQADGYRAAIEQQGK